MITIGAKSKSRGLISFLDGDPKAKTPRPSGLWNLSDDEGSLLGMMCFLVAEFMTLCVDCWGSPELAANVKTCYFWLCAQSCGMQARWRYRQLAVAFLGTAQSRCEIPRNLRSRLMVAGGSPRLQKLT